MIKEIDARLVALMDDCQNPKLKEAMLYSIQSGGKRLRPMLLLGACEAALGRYTDAAIEFACSLEMIHTYSLIHDDLPAMDNDDFRRGMPTSHKKFGEALAILAGDALLNRAFQAMAVICANDPAPPNLGAMNVITAAAGDNGMIAGQVEDINQSTVKNPDKEALFNVYRKKTGALFSAALSAGAMLGGGDPRYVKVMYDLGFNLGIAFQIKDDLLDNDGPFSLEEYEQISAEVLSDFEKIHHKTDTLRTIVQRVIDRVS